MSEPESENLRRIVDDVAQQLGALSARVAKLETKQPDAEDGVSDKELSDKEMKEELNFLTNRVSELVRYVAFGLAALCFVLLSSSSDFAKAMMQNHGSFILFL